LTDVRSGETYTIADLKGCVVYVETMATWCPSCRQQLTNVMTALPDIDRERVVIVAISVETDLDPATLASYAEQNAFDFVFSVASEDMLKSIVDEFGREAIVPPATPHFIVRADGSFTDLKTGFVDPADIVANIDAQLNPADGE
jgi:thiol-disulfide isomerase/thioredoxin